MSNDKIFDAKTLMAGRPDNLHKGSGAASSSGKPRERQTDEPDIENMIERSGCGEPYYKLEECLGEHDRDWK